MKKILTLIALFYSFTSVGQIQITASDMPVLGDTLRSSTSLSTSGIILSNTGANYNWDFSTLIPTLQTVDEYKTALSVNPLFGIIAPTAYGYKVADSFPTGGVPIPVTIKNLYTFFSKKNSPARYVAEGFAATISSIPTPVAYQDEDELYFFPLDFSVTNDSSNFDLRFNLAGFGSVRQKGYRKTTVDGWGTIKTPYYTTAVNCIRVRSEIRGTDTITISPLLSIPIPRNTVEYKWLANGEHYPALWVTANIIGSTETITQVRYRDMYRPGLLNVAQTPAISILKVYPNPVKGGYVMIDIPTIWQSYTIDLYDMQGKLVAQYQNISKLDISNIAKGNYLAVINHVAERAYAMISID